LASSKDGVEEEKSLFLRVSPTGARAMHVPVLGVHGTEPKAFNGAVCRSKSALRGENNDHV
jgi:hypothetical protein